MRQPQPRPFPARRCADGFEDRGPHDGCAEFEAPTWHPCRKPATHLAKVAAAPMQPADRVEVCAFHASNGLGSLAEVRVYRFRTVTS